MFGLVRPLECELKVRELTVYRAYYCGVCRAIGARCGQCARLTLQYRLRLPGAPARRSFGRGAGV